MYNRVDIFTYYIPSAKFFIGKFFANERKHSQMRSEDQLLANKSTRRSRGLLFDNNCSSDRNNLWMFELSFYRVIFCFLVLIGQYLSRNWLLNI
jgi:hypothetical protein